MKIAPSAGGLALIATLVLSGCSGEPALANPDLSGGRLSPCPASPNCVSSQAGIESQGLEPLRYSGDMAQAHQRLLEVLAGMERVQIRRQDADYIQAEFRSALFGFVDDATFHFDGPGTIQLRSASRIGYYDFGVNRKRAESIRARFAAAAGAR